MPGKLPDQREGGQRHPPPPEASREYDRERQRMRKHAGSPRIPLDGIREEGGGRTPREEGQRPSPRGPERPSHGDEKQRERRHPGEEDHEGLPEEPGPPERERSRDEPVRNAVGRWRQPEGPHLDERLPQRRPEAPRRKQILPLHREQQIPARDIDPAEPHADDQAPNDAGERQDEEPAVEAALAAPGMRLLCHGSTPLDGT